MEPLDKLNLRAGECSFLEVVLVDVRRYSESFAEENKKLVILHDRIVRLPENLSTDGENPNVDVRRATFKDGL